MPAHFLVLIGKPYCIAPLKQKTTASAFCNNMCFSFNKPNRLSPGAFYDLQMRQNSPRAHLVELTSPIAGFKGRRKREGGESSRGMIPKAMPTPRHCCIGRAYYPLHITRRYKLRHTLTEYHSQKCLPSVILIQSFCLDFVLELGYLPTITFSRQCAD